jgi:hypothetical protein
MPTTLVLSAIAAIVSQRMHLADSTIPGLLAGILAACCIADVRGTTRRHQPIEIAGLKGTAWFMGYQLLSAGTISLIATLPLTWIALSASADSLTTATGLASSLSAGLLASTIFVPAKRDITSQFAATLLCTATVVLLSRLAPPLDAQVATHIALSAILVLASLGIEQARNNFIWKGISRAS